ncbi:hypothetical protein CUJ84_pRLN3000488 (plasmid) [Rhizobium leguminosarum]|uniref:Uncharacterized protein n=1 Tax=Rhizobium leguminosarum TaxID=384 RepID=A0A2K9ZH89_RHILE|nr:hypothetical protein CUJ84_pRLN3000488 [Rhizobium leguminosarum]
MQSPCYLRLFLHRVVHPIRVGSQIRFDSLKRAVPLCVVCSEVKYLAETLIASRSHYLNLPWENACPDER